MSGFIGRTGSKSGVIGKMGEGWIKLGEKNITSDSGSEYVTFGDPYLSDTYFNTFMITWTALRTHYAGSEQVVLQPYLDGTIATDTLQRGTHHWNSDSSHGVNSSDSTGGAMVAQSIGRETDQGNNGYLTVDRPWDDAICKVLMGRSVAHQDASDRTINTDFTLGKKDGTAKWTAFRWWCTSTTSVKYGLWKIYGLK